MSDEAQIPQPGMKAPERISDATYKAPSSFAAPDGSARTEDLAMLIRRLCRVVARHDANNTVREQALDYLHRKGLGGSPLKAPNTDYTNSR